MKTSLLCLFLFTFPTLNAQIDYFPPLTGTEWDTLSFDELGWCDDQFDALCTHLEEGNTKAFLILKDGKIVVEKYFGDTNIDSNLPWNSAGKVITSILVGIAQEDGLLSIEDKTSDHLGTGWTSLPPEKEALITIENQLSMTSGLNDTAAYCVTPDCLTYLADAGDRWSYHNGPYTLLTNVIENASNQTINNYALQNLKLQTGIDGLYIPLGSNRVFFGSPRGMARMGSLILNQGTWDLTPVLEDLDYYNQMITPSQTINNAYGYLWWLNGSTNFMLPGSQIVFPGLIAPSAPDELIAALGKDGQFLDILPSQNIVVVRMGDAPDDDLVPLFFHDEMWAYLSEIFCESTANNEIDLLNDFQVFPNPFNDQFTITTNQSIETVNIYNSMGQLLIQENNTSQIYTKSLSSGIYWMELRTTTNQRVIKKIIKQ